MKIVNYSVAALAALLVVGSAGAMTTVTYTGNTNGSGPIGIGNTFTLTEIYDETATPTTGSGTNFNAAYSYYSLKSLAYSSGTYNLSLAYTDPNTTSVNYVIDGTDSGRSDQIIKYLVNNSNSYIETVLTGSYTTINSPAFGQEAAFLNSGQNAAYLSVGGSNYANTITSFTVSGSSAAPEPATWAMMIVGLGGVGYSMRRQRRARYFDDVAGAL